MGDAPVLLWVWGVGDREREVLISGGWREDEYPPGSDPRTPDPFPRSETSDEPL